MAAIVASGLLMGHHGVIGHHWVMESPTAPHHHHDSHPGNHVYQHCVVSLLRPVTLPPCSSASV